MPTTAVNDAVARLASRDRSRTESDIQADIYLLLTSGLLNLGVNEVVRLESQVGDGTRRRLDVEVGHCVIEVKKDLNPSGILKDAEEQLFGYVRAQTERLQKRYVGILTDGTEWRLYRMGSDELVGVAKFILSTKDPDAEQLLSWLESVLSTQHQISPIPLEIERRLGAESPAHKLDHSTLLSLYLSAADHPEVALKRDLWRKLLRTAFGTAFTNDEHLFINHTLLVLTAEIIAHAVVGYDVSPSGPLTPHAMARGTAFADSQINGVVEADFFDWVLEVPGGPEFVSDLARRIAQFDWSHVEHDVLKILYESVINSEARASLGEYYTPDWLAEQMVGDTVTDPLESKVLDPSCGSGTFLFHAVRAYLAAADAAGISNGDAVLGATRSIYGMDVHPVAVTLARVTYLLAIGKHRLIAEDRGEVNIPVYLGDSLQWEQRKDLFSGEEKIVITTAGDDLVEGGGGVLFGDDLIFPRSVLSDAEQFDRLVQQLADKALDTSGKYSRTLVSPILRRFEIEGEDANIVTTTFDTMRKLHNSGRDHIWGYYVRNLIRPLWMAEAANRVDVLIGNPPWLRYNKMTPGMQARYKNLAKERQLLTGGLGASARDLSTLFVVRAVELYLRQGGKFSFVMPHGTLTRRPHAGFRTGKWSSRHGEPLNAQFDVSWDLVSVTTGFPMHSCVVRGQKTMGARAIPAEVTKWHGKLPRPDVPWAVAQEQISQTSATLRVLAADSVGETSPYKKRFRQGAILVPRMLLFVEEDEPGPLGPGRGRVRVTSKRTTQEKPPWKHLPALSDVVETEFVRPVYLGENIAPFRALAPLRAVLPITGDQILSPVEIELHSAMSRWWDKVESVWRSHRVESESLPLLERFDHLKQLSAQLPIPTHRIVYTKSGNRLSAARVTNVQAVIDHKLYWAPAESVAEAQYLTAILNSETVLERVRPLQAMGLFGPRDFDKHVFSIPIPAYNSADPSHIELAQLAAQAEEIATRVHLNERWTFQRSRKEIRQAIEDAGIAGRIESAVSSLIPPVTIS